MGGDQEGPSIFLIFTYINRQNVLIPNMVLKNVYGCYVRGFEHFKFQNSTYYYFLFACQILKLKMLITSYIKPYTIFNTIFGISTFFLLIYVKISKIEVPS